MSAVATGITADSVLIGGASAQASANGEDDADVSGWTPGDTKTASEIATALGLASLLAPGSGGGEGGELPDIAGDMADGYLGVTSRVLAGWDPDVAADELGSMLADAVADGAYAEGLTITQITIVSGQAALQWYLANGGVLLQWVTDGDNPCAVCVANAKADPRPAGVPWPSGDLTVPSHPNCRCALVAISGGGVPGIPDGPDVIDEPGDAGADGEGEEPGGDEGDDESGDEADEGEDLEDSGGEEAEGAEPEDAAEAEATGTEKPPEFSPLEFPTTADADQWLKDNRQALTPEQYQAVEWYTGSGSDAVNLRFRQGASVADLPEDALGVNIRAEVAALDSAMSPLPADLVLDRVVGADAFGGEDELGGLAGKVITDQAYQSTSLGGPARSSGVRMHIAAPAGTPAVVIGNKFVVGEREVLLARGTQLAVSQAEEVDGQWHLYLTVVPS